MNKKICIYMIKYKTVEKALSILNGLRGKTQSHLRKNLYPRYGLQAITLAITLFRLDIIYRYREPVFHYY